MNSTAHMQAGRRLRVGIAMMSILSVLGGTLWLMVAARQAQALPSVPPAALIPRLESGAVARMDSPIFRYDEGWRVDAAGADPREPADPWTQPSGVVTFDYAGNELALELAVGAYWGYLYVTVDDEPANLLAVIPGNGNSLGESAGYKTFYEPEKTADGAPVSRWVRVHGAAGAPDALHTARVEVWRSWGQIPLRSVAVDALPPPPLPQWPGVALILLGGWLAVWWRVSRRAAQAHNQPAAREGRRSLLPVLDGIGALVQRVGLPWAIGALTVVAAGVWLDVWFVALLGLALLAGVALWRPALWWAALLLALPFYFAVTIPIMPGRALGLIDVGILGGALILGTHWVLGLAAPPPARNRRWDWGGVGLLVLIASWALVSTFAAAHQAVALREWRTVFLSATIFAALLTITLRRTPQRDADLWLVVGAWLAGGVLMALIGLGQYASDTMLIHAEGVRRVRGLYGSPNNLALYLERTLAVTLGLALLLPTPRWRWVAGGCALIQLGALLLTFSKGAILLALPAMLIVLALVGALIPPQRRPPHLRLWLVGIALIAVLVLAPFLNTDRFQGLLNPGQGTGFLRIQLWRSAWQMALDHPLLGVGPDNFLYAFRSRYILPAAWQEPNLNHPHNWPLDWWTRLGIPGLLAALLLFGYAALRMARNVWQNHHLALNAGLLAATLAALAHGLIDTSYALPDLMIIWAFFLVLAQETGRGGLR